MKKLLVLITIFMFFSITPIDVQAKGKRTKHKIVKKMSKRQVRNAQKGKSFYYRNSRGKLKKRRF